MAEASISISQDEFNCSICLRIMNDPVTIPCGHSFCMGCIMGYWSIEMRQPCKCPLCKRNYAQRPVLGKNTILAEMLLKMKNKNKSRPTNSPVGRGDVACDFCLDQKQKAVLRCLKCQACFCKDHVIPHQKSAAFKSHPLMKISKGSWKTCTYVGHGLPCDIFCDDDQQCLCLRCLEWGHKQHRLRSAEEEVPRKQEEIKAKMADHERKIQGRMKELQELSKAAETIKSSAIAAVQNSETIFNEIIGSIQQRRIAMTNLIRAHEKADLGRVNAFVKQVSFEITTLKEKYADLEQLLQTKDLTTFLETSKKICQPLGSESLPPVSINTNSLKMKMSVQKTVQKLKQSMESILQVEFAKITVQPDSAIVSPEPLIRKDFLKYASPIALDVNTAYDHLKLSDGNKQVVWTDESQNYLRIPQRFTYYNHVLGKECLSAPS